MDFDLGCGLVLQDGATSTIKELLGALDERRYYLIIGRIYRARGDLCVGKNRRQNKLR